MTEISRTYVYPLTLARRRSHATAEGGERFAEGGRPARPDLGRELSDVLLLESEEAGELLLVCHAEPEGGRGAAASLSVGGRVQARRLASRLSALWVEAVYCSPEPSTAETAGIIAAALERPVTLLPELSDIGYDAALAAGEASCTRLQDRFLALPRWDALPGFESSRSFRVRTVAAIEAVVEQHAGRRLVLVTHASVINAYLSLLLDIPRDLFFQPDYTSISCLRFEQGIYALRSLNDTAHLTSICVQWPEGR